MPVHFRHFYRGKKKGIKLQKSLREWIATILSFAVALQVWVIGFPSQHTLVQADLYKRTSRYKKKICGLRPLPVNLPEEHNSTTESGISSSHHYPCLLFQCHQLSQWMYDPLLFIIMSPFLNVTWWCWIGQSFSSVTDTFGFWFLTHALALQEAAARNWDSFLWSFAACVHHSLTHYSRATCLSNTVRRDWAGSQLLCVFMKMREKMCKIENGHLDTRQKYWATHLQRRWNVLGE